MLRVYKSSSVEWKPSAIVALATSVDGSQVAAARADGSLEIWLVSPGSHCQLTIHGDPNSRVSSLVWCRPGSRGGSLGRLLSSNIDGSVSEWDCIDLKQKIVLDTIGVTIWQIAAESPNDRNDTSKHETISENGHAIHSISSDTDEEEDSESEDDVDRGAAELRKENNANYTRLAFACDDGCLRIYNVSDEEKLTYNRTLPRVGGHTLSVTWSLDSKRIFSGSSDGFIRCWDANLGNEIYRITVGLGSVASQNDLCIWSLLALRCGTIVSGDSSGSVQFWDGKFGTLLQSNSYHKGDVNALAAASSHDRVFSAGADGQVILYKLSSDAVCSNDVKFVPEAIKKWNYVGYVRSHTHDVRALAVALPISHEADMQPYEKVKRQRSKKKPLDFSYPKWAHLGMPMLISAGDDTKLFAYSVNDFTKFSPHDICPAPQRMPMQLVLKKDKTDVNHTPLLLVQAAHCLDIYYVRLKNSAVSDIGPGPSGAIATTELVARVKCKATSKILCSAISSSGTSFSYSDHLKPNLFELKRSKSDKNVWTVNKRKLPKELPFAHSIIYSSDSSQLLVAGHDRRIHIIDVENAKLVHVFTPCRKDYGEESPPSEPPITKMFTSTDGHWLAAVNCFGDLYIFDLKTLRQHWFMSRMDGASVTAGGFTPRNSNILIITTSSNQVYALDVEAKQLEEGSMQHTFSLHRRYQEFPGDVIGLSFPLSYSSSSVIVYSSRAMCFIDFGTTLDKENDSEKSIGKLYYSNGGLKRKAIVHELETNKHNSRKNFEICPFRDPVLFVEHLPKNSLLVIDKPWIQVVNTFEALPVHRHIYGS